MSRAKPAEATGVIDDLFAQMVGFYAGWGFSRTLTVVGEDLITGRGNVAWRGLDRLVAATLCDVLGAPGEDAKSLPAERGAAAARLYMRVAVGQHVSGWARCAARASHLERLVLLRCHAGKQRVRGARRNLVLLQYRVWRRSRRGKPRRVTAAGPAWRLLADVHAEMVKRIAGG